MPSMTAFATELISDVVFLLPECVFALWYAAGMTRAVFVGQHFGAGKVSKDEDILIHARVINELELRTQR